MKIDVIDWIKIETPDGDAIIKDYTWSSDNKDLESKLNEEFGKSENITTHEQRQIGVAVFVLADRAIRKLGGKIIKIKKHTITKE
jgi:hypothetical protein